MDNGNKLATYDCYFRTHDDSIISSKWSLAPKKMNKELQEIVDAQFTKEINAQDLVDAYEPEDPAAKARFKAMRRIEDMCIDNTLLGFV